MEIDLEHDEEKDVFFMKLKGKLDVFSFAELKGYFDELYEKTPSAKVVCEIDEVSYIASSGWSVLLARRKIARRENGDLCLVGMSGDIKRVYDSMKIGKLLPHRDDRIQAVALIVENAE
jgi:stage II sporulation protein AA (anti-sigma F factor antagonist)